MNDPRITKELDAVYFRAEMNTPDVSEEIKEAYFKFIHPYDPYIAVYPVDDEAYFIAGWNACKERILNLLKQPIQNADLSWEEVDKRFIDKIEKL